MSESIERQSHASVRLHRSRKSCGVFIADAMDAALRDFPENMGNFFLDDNLGQIAEMRGQQLQKRKGEAHPHQRPKWAWRVSPGR